MERVIEPLHFFRDHGLYKPSLFKSFIIVDGYKVCIGGRWGKRVAQGRPLEMIIEREEDVLKVVEKCILLFREQGITGERFADTISRIGFENVQAQLLSALILKADESVQIILWQLRLPRLLAGVLAGIGLSAAGVLLQSVTANELASPNIIGINSGAGLAVILILTAFPSAGAILPLGAFLGAFSAATVILLAANRLGSARSVILLIGITITTILNAAISFLSLLDEGVLAQYNHFTVGSLKAVRLHDLTVPAVIIALAFTTSMAMSHRLGILRVGDSAAAAMGVRIKSLRVAALSCAAACAAAVVSFAGLLGFVGLVVPHIAKRLVGQQPKRILPVSALLGAVTVTAADLLGRTLFAPSELPVGILMSLVGAPYFLILLCRRERHADIP